MTVRSKIEIKGLAGVLKTLEELPPELVSKAGGPVKLGLMKAMRMMAEQMKQNLQDIINEPNKNGLNESTGLLKQNIRASRVRLNGERGEAVRARVRNKRYPPKPVEDDAREREGQPKPVTTAQIARLLEYGSERLQPPKPFIRPAFNAKKDEAIDIFVSELQRRIGAIVRKLARQNRVAS